MRLTASWLAHPVSLCGLVLLLLNDHVLKPLWPGPVTGKLSDVAGMLVFPPLLALVLALSRASARAVALSAIFLTAVGFSAIKSSGYAAGLASDLLSVLVGQSLVRADAWDLLALPALGLAWAAFRQAERQAASDRPPSPDARLAGLAVLLPLALLGTAATSCAPGPPPATLHKDFDGSVWLIRDGSYWLVSRDGGETFTRTEPAVRPPMLTQECLGDACYRVASGRLRVEQSLDGGRTWSTAWELGSGAYRDLAARYRTCLGEPGRDLASQSLVVLARGSGHVVLVTNGSDGVLRRDTDGRWHRIGRFGEGGQLTEAQPLSQVTIPGGNAPFAVAVTVLLLLLGWLGAAALRARRAHRLLAVFAVVSAAALYTGILVMFKGDSLHPAVVYAAALAVLAAAGLAGWLAFTLRHRLHPGWSTASVLLIGTATVVVEDLRNSGPVMFLVSDLMLRGFVVAVVFAFTASAGSKLRQTG